ncbi:hypothetical protein DJ568_03590 [Mucilaginibacter hurinus]|uniref:Uncharacterized protein n=1 Tax=Mucilaginibacter hurinus TaxID=2201324 RepID=A0A367GSV9_9SPHI|nr:hypothetical protein [Mucilaginibacter hurinus]RCH55851.1 hypothetical protein DJ568_03590 [Mucilaginibacter hurinus]
METINDNLTERDDPREDQLGENSGNDHAKGTHPTVQDKPDDERVKTVAPDNDSGAPGPPAEESASNKGQGPKGENL